MPTFTYTARNATTGQEVFNTLEAETEQDAVGVLLKHDLLVVSIAETLGKKGKTSGGKVESCASTSDRAFGSG